MIEWTSALETGHAMVDRDHRTLINSLNELERAMKDGAGREEISRLITFLNHYTRGHFAREETHMACVGCPAQAQNKQAHRELIAKLDQWVVRLQQGATTSLTLEVYRETSRWITGHILSVDCKLRECHAA
jgi:hemerythrin-like metal-binding protein